jgi:hypothetical protein
MGRVCGTYKEKGKACGILVKNPEEKQPLGRPSRTWDDIIKTDLKEFSYSFALRNIVWTDERVGGYDLYCRHVATLQIVFGGNKTELNVFFIITNQTHYLPKFFLS